MRDWPGTPEQRDARRAWAIGLAVWPAICDEPDRWIIEGLRELTEPGDRWIWHPDSLKDPKNERTRSVLFGRYILREWEQTRRLQYWSAWAGLARAVDEWRESWLWGAACLEADGWHEAAGTVTLDDGSKEVREAWTKVRL